MDTNTMNDLHQSNTILHSTCPNCGHKLSVPSNFCSKCGSPLAKHIEQPGQIPDPSYSGIIPYKNTHALLSYYFGLFSFFPLLGILLGIASIVLGFIGLKNAKLNPGVKGKVHAIVGIIFAFLFIIVHVVIFIAISII